MKKGNITFVLKRLIIGIFSSGLLLVGTTFAEAQTVTSPPQKKLTPGILWDQILAKHITYIQEGHRGPIIYDFQDPNCPYCHVMYEHEAPLIKAGKLTVRYVPVAFLTPPESGGSSSMAPVGPSISGSGTFRNHRGSRITQWELPFLAQGYAQHQNDAGIEPQFSDDECAWL